MVYITNKELKSLKQLLVIARELNEILEAWLSVGIVTERTFGIENQITNMILEQLDIDSEGITPLATSVFECISRDISIEELMERARLPTLE